MEDFGDFGDDRYFESYDPYDAMPFGDAIRFEENQLAMEQYMDEDAIMEAEDTDEYYDCISDDCSPMGDSDLTNEY